MVTKGAMHFSVCGSVLHIFLFLIMRITTAGFATNDKSPALYESLFGKSYRQDFCLKKTIPAAPILGPPAFLVKF